ncbi:MAG: hypothetical protein HY905_19470 [Deltaproteobacteria bacterium]|nr:hypothetical protein [Deltaproteobacteria bacterium]
MTGRFWDGRVLGAMLVIGAGLALGCVGDGSGFTLGEPDQTSSALTVDESEVAATVVGASVRVDVPVERPLGDGALAGTVGVRLVDTAGEEKGEAEGALVFRAGETAATISLTMRGLSEGLAPGDLAGYVVRYRVEAGGAVVSGSRSLFRMARRIGSLVLGPSQLFAEEPAQFRVSAVNPGNGRPMAGATVEAFLETPAAGEGGDPVRTPVGTVTTDEFGLAEVDLDAPAIAGSATLIIRTQLGEQASESRHGLTVQRAHRILLTTDKPLYQPGQTMHVRALAFRLPHNAPSADVPVTIEIADGKGNKVFRQDATTNDYGIASAEFTLARQVNMGRYTIRAGIEDAIQERTVTVDRYSLPKFNIGFTADKAFYTPGETVFGQLDARYFFGQPVAGGEVVVRASQFDVDWVQFAEVHGTTGEDGLYSFSVELPDYFVGLPLDQGGSFAKLDITVIDTAGQTFEIERPVTVARGGVGVTLIPERPVLVPGVANVMFLLTADPTGTPLASTCNVTAGGGTPIPVQTDERGFASFEVTPAAGVALSIVVDAGDGHGGSVTQYFSFSADGTGNDTVLLRTDKSLYEVGETARLTIYTPRAHDRVYLDAVREGQTMLTKIVPIDEGWTNLNLDLADDLSGSVTLSVYFLGDTGDIVRDQRVIYVEGADGLNLQVRPDRTTYQPAETARLELEVTDAAGQGVQAAVGLQVVDEAVFALSEVKPGLERIFFELEDDIAESRYEVHGFGAGDIFGAGEPDTADAEAQEAARVLFAAAGGRAIYGVDYSSERGLLDVVLGHESTAVGADAQRIATALTTYQSARGDWSESTAQRWIDRMVDGWYDAWGQRYQARYEWSQITLTSAGCDEIWGTDDDAVGYAWGGGEWAFGGVDDENGGGRGDVPGAAADAGTDPSTPPSEPGVTPPEVRIRSWFPETLYVNPSIITDADGRAAVDVPLADSITSWRMTGVANSLAGGLGSTLGNITVFQEFFVDLALPATLTLGDEITVPVVVYNYLDEAQTVELEVTEDDWFTLLTPATSTLTLEPRQVSSVPVRIRVEKVGWHDLEAIGRAGELGDGLRRRIEVMPSGKRTDQAQSDMIEATPDGARVRFEFAPPAGAVTGANELLVKLYPGVFAQAIEGLDSILKLPNGCFEQTSSSTYPNVMALAYMQASGTTTPEIELRAREYINQGYQRLLTYEVPGGGFEWFGSPPAHKILTAYGLMEFSDMAKVHNVDPAVISRTAAWLAGRQESDGSWAPDPGGIAEGAINNYQNSKFRTTAYVLWALLESGYDGPAVASATAYLAGHIGEAADAYSRAIAAQALITHDASDPVGAELLDQLAAEGNEESGAMWWGEEGGDGGLTYSTGDAHILETTALVVDVFFRGRAYLPEAQKGLAYLVRSKDSFGNWETTQATVYALRAMLRSMDAAGSEADATIDVFHNGELVHTLTVTPADYDIFRQVDLKDRIVEGGPNDVEIVMTGTGSMMYQAVGTYWTPWDGVPPEEAGPLTIDVGYDRTHLAVDDKATATVILTNNTTGDLMMVIADLGIPPGFDVETEDLDALVGSGTFRRYELTARQIIVYFDLIGPGAPLEFTYDVIARNPMRGEAPPSDAYLYYDPSRRHIARPIPFEVAE